MVAWTTLNSLVKNEALRNKLGFVYLVLGISKVALAVGFIVAPEEIKKVPVVGNFAKPNKDYTAAGMVYEFVYLALAFFAVLLALSMYGVFPVAVTRVLQNKRWEYAMLAFLGFFMTIFYALVLFTDIGISKDERNTEYYRFWGFLGGIAIVVIPIIAEALKLFTPLFRSMSLNLQSAIILGVGIVVYAVATAVFLYVHANSIAPEITNKIAAVA